MAINERDIALNNFAEALSKKDIKEISNAFSSVLTTHGIHNQQEFINEVRSKVITEDKVRDLTRISELEIREKLKDELATKRDIDRLDKRIDGLEARIDSVIFFLKILIVLNIIFMTIFNPNIINLVKYLATVI